MIKDHSIASEKGQVPLTPSTFLLLLLGNKDEKIRKANILQKQPNTDLPERSYFLQPLQKVHSKGP